MVVVLRCFFFQAEDGIRDLVRSRGLGDVYKRQLQWDCRHMTGGDYPSKNPYPLASRGESRTDTWVACLLYTSDAADER